MHRTLADDRTHLPEILEATLRQATDYLESLDRRDCDVAQRLGRAFLTGTTLHGTPAVRVAVSNWRTEEKDVEITLAAMTDAARAV